MNLVMVLRISSTSNEFVKLCKRLHRKKHRDASGLVLLEGKRLIEDAGVVETLAVTSDVRVDVIAKRTLTLDPTVLKACCDTTTPQGAVAVAKKPSLKVESPRLVLVVEARDPGNVGTLIRTAAAAGVDGVVSRGADPYSPKALRSAMGATFRVPVVDGDWHKLTEEWGITQVLAADADEGTVYDEVDWTLPSALIVGGEVGLSDDFRDVDRVRIPIAASVESLNAGVAGSVILLEAARQRRLT